MILISIVIPTYNRAHVLPRAIDSVIAQTYSHWELLIVDDGSDDSTQELVAEYIKEEPRIKYFRRPEDRLRGGNACRNIGAEHAAGEYVAYLDSDDYWRETRLAGCAGFIEKERPDCFYSGRILDNYSERIIGSSRAFKPGETPLDFLLSRDALAVTSSFVLRRDVFRKFRWDEQLKRTQDWDFFIRVASKFEWQYFDNFDVVFVRKKGERKYIHIPSCLKVYRMYRGQVSNFENANTYLRSMLEYCSKYYDNISYASEYFLLLNENNYSPSLRDRFQVGFPYLFYCLYRIKKFIYKTK